MSGALQTFEATPSLVGNKVKWKLCYTSPTTDVCGEKGNFPNVELTKGQGAYPFKFKIVNDTTGKGIIFADGALVIKKGEPFGPGKDKQIGDVNIGNGSKELTFTDLNSLPNSTHPAAVKITYGLHFTDQNGDPVTSIDPDITNGGTNIIEPPPGIGPGSGFGGGIAEHLPAFGIGLLAGLILTLLVQRFLR